ncbi:MAG: DUF1015 family protein [Dehalococcoidia bacterium]|nr:DUF1015 family protein [Dehalococcoidia bacterium]
MADFRPFQALRYDPAVAGEPETLIAPPYDVVSEDDRPTLYMRGPFNVSLIDYGEEFADDSDEDNRYTRSALDIEAWREIGVLKQDEQPTLYVYDQEFEVAGQRLSRRSIFGRLQLEEWDKKIILPHEQTGAAAKADRLRLLQATRVHLSPILALYEGDLVPPIPEAAIGAPVFRAIMGSDKHFLRPVSPAAAEDFTKALAEQRLYIADGHHRYETGLNYRNERRAAASNWTGEEPENFIIAALVSTTDPGLVCLPTHRLLKLTNRPDNLVAALAPLLSIEPAGDVSDYGVETLVAKMAAAGRDGLAFGAAGLEPGKLHLLTPKKIDELIALTSANQSDAWRRLDVALLHAVLPFTGFVDSPDNIDYSEWPYHAASEVNEGRWDLAMLLNPTPVVQVMNIADGGEVMPRKSTFFFPKLATGVVMYPLD